jgi:glutathione S-transferase
VAAASYTFFTNPMSRGQIVRWALHEAGADYEQVLVDWANKPPALLAANPMGKVPTVIHHSAGGDRVVTEAGAICHYLAEMHPEAHLHPRDDEMADYFRWMFFTAGPAEQAISAKNFGFDPKDPQQQAMAGFGSFERTMTTLEQHLTGRDFVCGERFTMADVYVGSLIDWGLNFGIIPPQFAFVSYVEGLRERDAYRKAKAIDGRLIEELKK